MRPPALPRNSTRTISWTLCELTLAGATDRLAASRDAPGVPMVVAFLPADSGVHGDREPSDVGRPGGSCRDGFRSRPRAPASQGPGRRPSRSDARAPAAAGVAAGGADQPARRADPA